MAAIPSAGPEAMSVATAVDRARRLAQRHSSAAGRPGEAEDHVRGAAGELGVVGERRHGQVLGDLDERDVRRRVRPDEGGLLELPAGTDHGDAAHVGQQVGGRDDHPALGDGDAEEVHGAVRRVRLELDDRLGGGLRGRRDVARGAGVGGQRGGAVAFRPEVWAGRLRGGGEEDVDERPDGNDGGGPDAETMSGPRQLRLGRGQDRPGDRPARRPPRRRPRRAPARSDGATGGRRGRSSRAAATRARPGPLLPRRVPVRRFPAPRVGHSPGRGYRERPQSAVAPASRRTMAPSCRGTWPSTSVRPTRWCTPRGRAWCSNEPTVVALDYAQPGGPGDRDGRLADDRPHARLHRGGAPAARRRHHRLRGDRADAQRPVAPGGRGTPQPAQGPDLRPLGHHVGRAPGGQGGGAAGRRVVELPDRAADGGGDRRGPGRSTSRWGTWWSTSAEGRPRWR